VGKRVLIAAPRSFCAGVVRAIDIVEKLLETHGPPVYVRHQIVHNVHVVRDLESRGAIFVETEQEVPEGALVVLSAHGVAPSVYRMCAERSLQVIDATCPLVSKVHAEARRYAARGLKIALVGHARHEEVVGTMGEAPESITLVETIEDVESLEVEEGQQVAYLTQTTLSVDDTAGVVEALRERYPDLVGPPSADICYATQNRQDAVKKICEHATLVLVVGSKTSSNANRLVEVARSRGADAHLVDDEGDLDLAWLDGHEVIGLTAGASSPDLLVTRVADRLAEHGYVEREEVELTREDVYFRLPAALRDR
jgi:4-hydroxy-3-methylbut-2-enyl diphosphate reductase